MTKEWFLTAHVSESVIARSDVAILCGGDSYTIEIAKLPSVAREDGNFWDNLVPLISRLS